MSKIFDLNRIFCTTAEAKLTAAQLANQVWLRMREEVSLYYESYLCIEDEQTQTVVRTRDLPLSCQVQFEPRALLIWNCQSNAYEVALDRPFRHVQKPYRFQTYNSTFSRPVKLKVIQGLKIHSISTQN